MHSLCLHVLTLFYVLTYLCKIATEIAVCTFFMYLGGNLTQTSFLVFQSFMFLCLKQKQLITQ